MTSRGIRRCALGCTAALLSLAPAAHAAAPEPCDGALLVKDAAGDQIYKVNGNPAPSAVPQPPASTDVVGLFFRSDEGKITANVVMTDLAKTVPQGFSAVRYRVYFTVAGTVHYLQALLTSSGVAYTHGVQVVIPGYSFYEKTGDTTGAFHEGKNGVVQIVIPAGVAKEGAKLDAIAASNGVLSAAATPEEGQTAGTYTAVDAAPDSSPSKITTAAPADCPPPAVPAAPAAPEVPAPAAEAPAPPAVAPAAPLGAPFDARGDLRMSVAKPTLSSRKVKRRLRLSLRSTETLTFVTVKLQRGSRVLSRLDLDTIGARTTLRMKLRRPLARRAHTLVVTGTRPDGTMTTQRVRLRVKR